jgi:hypothetical protein
MTPDCLPYRAGYPGAVTNPWPQDQPPTRRDPYADPSVTAPGYGPGGYGPDPYAGQYGYPSQPGHPPPYGPPKPNNALAIASLVLSLASIWCLGLSAPVGAILGHVARAQIRRSGENGDNMALTGIIVGWIVTALAVAAFGILVVAVVVEVNHQTGR